MDIIELYTSLINEFENAVIIAGLIFCIGLFGLLIKIRLPFYPTVFLKKVFFIVGVILLISAFLSHFDIYLKGYLTTRVFIWFFLVLAAFLFCFGDRKATSKPLKIIMGLIFFFPSTSILWYFLVPVMGPVLTMSIWGGILGNMENIYYSDKDLRIQKVYQGAMGLKGPPNYFKKGFIFEYDKGFIPGKCYDKPDSIKVYKTDDTISVYYYHSKDDNIYPLLFKLKR